MELVIVIAILATLAALLVPRILIFTDEARRSKEITNARMIAGDVASYNAFAKQKGLDTIPATLSGDQELTNAMLDTSSLALSDPGSFPDSSIVKIMVDSKGNTEIVIN